MSFSADSSLCSCVRGAAELPNLYWVNQKQRSAVAVGDFSASPKRPSLWPTDVSDVEGSTPATSSRCTTHTIFSNNNTAAAWVPVAMRAKPIGYASSARVSRVRGKTKAATWRASSAAYRICFGEKVQEGGSPTISARQSHKSKEPPVRPASTPKPPDDYAAVRKKNVELDKKIKGLEARLAAAEDAGGKPSSTPSGTSPGESGASD